MRYGWFLIGLLAGCGGGDVGFGHTNTNNGSNVQGTASMTLNAESFTFTDAEVNKAQSDTLVVTSTGDAVLHVRSGTITGDQANQFYTDTTKNEDLDLTNGQDAEMTVVCLLTEPVKAVASFHLATNDRERPELDIPLTCTPVGWQDTGDTDTDTP